jgi:signal transduction histidine kinase
MDVDERQPSGSTVDPPAEPAETSTEAVEASSEGAVEVKDSWTMQSTAAPHSTAPSARWLSILQQVTEGAIAHLELQQMLCEVLGRIGDAMAADNAAILLVSDDGTYLNLYAARGPEEPVTGNVHVRMGRGIAGTIAETGKPMIVDDLSQVEVENPLLLKITHSLVGVPLFVRDHVIGVIHVDSARPRQFTEEDSQLLQVIASRVSLAVEHAQLYKAERTARREAEAATRHLQALQSVSDVAMEHAQLQDLLRALLTHIQELMQVDNVAILLPSPEGTDLTLYSVSGPEEAVMGLVHVPMGQGVAGTIAATRTPLIIENLKAVPVANPFLREHFRSLLGVPLLDDGQLVGVIHVDSITPRMFSDDERQLLEVLAERIARAIARAQQFERMQQSRVQAEHRVALLEETTDRMDEFLSIASHELRTPLTSLNMNVQMLDYWLHARQGKRPDESAEGYAARALATVLPLVQRSNQNIKRLDRLVGDLLDASRVRENRLELKLDRIDLAAVVREAVEEQRQAQPKRRIRLEIEPAAPVVVEVDPDRIEQVVSNYLSNALKYSRPDQPVVVVLGAEAQQARVAVRDEGVGIPESELEHVWERFYRVPGIGHQSGSQVGLGLGLYISCELVTRHGGQVGVQSAPGKGSTFWFTLPLAPTERRRREEWERRGSIC